MKRQTRFLLLTFALVFLFSACKPAVKPQDTGDPQKPNPSQNTGDTRKPDTSQDAVKLENLLLVDRSDNGSLLLASAIADDNSLYLTSLASDFAVTIDGQSKSAKDLKNGMLISLQYQGGLAESYPAQIMEVASLNASTVSKEEYPDLVGFLLEVSTKLWEKDTALNGKMVAFDFSKFPIPLSQNLQNAVAYRFSATHNVDARIQTREELEQDGSITKDGFLDGCLITFEPAEQGANPINEKGTLNFNVSKWKSPKGAIFWTNCKAEWVTDGEYPVFTIGQESVS